MCHIDSLTGCKGPCKPHTVTSSLIPECQPDTVLARCRVDPAWRGHGLQELSICSLQTESREG